MPKHSTAGAWLIAALLCGAAAHAPQLGSYGFNWLNPEEAQCAPLSAAQLKQFTTCEYRPEGTFGEHDPAFECRKSTHSVYFFYQSRAACQRNLETMQANAP